MRNYTDPNLQWHVGSGVWTCVLRNSDSPDPNKAYVLKDQTEYGVWVRDDDGSQLYNQFIRHPIPEELRGPDKLDDLKRYIEVIVRMGV